MSWQRRLATWFWNTAADTVPQEMTSPTVKYIIDSGITGLVEGMAIGVREPELAKLAVREILASVSFTPEEVEAYEQSLDRTIEGFREAAAHLKSS